MVSLWPWKSTDDTASFEKALSSLSAKISKANVSRDNLRARSRRYKVLWTLYTSLAYLLSAVILVLVTGWRNWGPIEYTVVAGSPLIIYLVRTALSSYYGYRLSSNQAYLAQLQKQKEEAIEKFKTATKYNTTQQLLEKYGAAPEKPAESTRKPKSAPGSSRPQKQQARTGIAPPPTANIRRPGDAVYSPSTPVQPQTPLQQQNTPHSTPGAQPASAAFNPNSPGATQAPSPTAEFAPNAFTTPPQYSAASSSSPSGRSDAFRPQWYDRVMDLLLGEDETKASSRLALICEHCRLVNGQAPPGVRTLEDVGRWRCGGCRGWNGVDKASEVKKIVQEVAAAANGAGAENESAGARTGDTDEPSVVGVAQGDDSREQADDGDEVREVNGVDDIDEDDYDDDGELLERESEDADDVAEDDGVLTSDGADADEPPARSTRSQRTANKAKG